MFFGGLMVDGLPSEVHRAASKVAVRTGIDHPSALSYVITIRSGWIP